jgi:hypothetical protein
VRTALSLALVLVAIMHLTTASPARADPHHDAGLWFMAAAQGPISKENPRLSRWRWWFDGHARFFEDSDGYGQSIVRPGVGYAISDKSTLWVGYGWIRTSPPSGSDFDENRIWQQWTTSASLATATLSWRSRLEQRFVEGGDDVGWRFRQFVKLSQPIAFDSRLRLVGYDEIFFGLNTTDWGAQGGLDQNRLFAGLGWQVEQGTNIEVGYLNQFVRRQGTEDLMNHILSLNLLLRF